MEFIQNTNKGARLDIVNVAAVKNATSVIAVVAYVTDYLISHARTRPKKLRVLTTITRNYTDLENQIATNPNHP